ncbi:hypothetical protein F8C76_01640 [Flagellimonas olearia]|uniref:ABM domain-containing protein n=1 Tax=Flagellimonas olearia TaxID=552546 RepID=A0A6I1DY82_9FLAO|nr:ester cyclase [Allomuricauda olearia]KAB7530238.1 hypothetical protein F8C76_01640 [Allomuricauda olearia]
MKPKKLLVLLLSIQILQSLKAQENTEHSRPKTMEVKIEAHHQNKELINHLYHVIINERKWDELSKIISEKYINDKGHVGVKAFKNEISGIIDIFPTASWSIEELICEDNKVVVKQTIKGTRQIDSNNHLTSDDTRYSTGYVIYTLEGGKILDFEILTARPSFLQQLDNLSSNRIEMSDKSSSKVYFVDRFVVPKKAYSEFLGKMSLSRDVIKKLPGFIKDEVMINDEDGTSVKMVTIALWESLEHFENAKERAFEEYKKVNFDPRTFTQRLGIQREREVYKAYKE